MRTLQRISYSRVGFSSLLSQYLFCQYSEYFATVFFYTKQVVCVCGVFFGGRGELHLDKCSPLLSKFPKLLNAIEEKSHNYTYQCHHYFIIPNYVKLYFQLCPLILLYQYFLQSSLADIFLNFSIFLKLRILQPPDSFSENNSIFNFSLKHH